MASTKLFLSSHICDSNFAIQVCEVLCRASIQDSEVNQRDANMTRANIKVNFAAAVL